MKGKGCFVAGVPEENTARKKELLKEIADASEELKFMGIQKDEVIAVIDKCMEDLKIIRFIYKLFCDVNINR